MAREDDKSDEWVTVIELDRAGLIAICKDSQFGSMHIFDFLARRVFLIGFLILSSAVGRAQAASGCAGALDLSFLPFGIEPVSHIFFQPDGKVLAVEFGRIYRFHTNGVYDSSYAVTAEVQPGGFMSIQDAVMQPDGKLVLAGGFDLARAPGRTSVVRLNLDGSLDTNFVAHANSAVTALELDREGRILIGGSFTNVNDTPQPRLARLLPTGAIDPTFQVGLGPDQDIWELAMTAAGQVMALGNFTNFNAVTAHRVVRLEGNGAVDRGFVFPEAGGGPWKIKPLPSGEALLYGNEVRLGDSAPRWMARLKTNGQIDPNFNPQVDGPVRTAAIQADGKIFVGGEFRSVETAHYHLLARLRPDGALDREYLSGIHLISGCGSDHRVSAIALQPDSKLVVSGMFFEVNGIARGRFVRLLNDGHDCAGLISLEKARTELLEATTNVQVRVRRQGPANRYVSALLTTTPNSPHFQWSRQEVEFLPGEKEKLLSLPMVDDKLAQGSATTTLTLSHPRNGAVFNKPNSMEVTVIDDETLGQPGSTDFSFQARLQGFISDLEVESNGKTLLAGSFALGLEEDMNFLPANELTGIARLHPDGSEDTTFRKWKGMQAHDLAVLPDGKILAAAPFDFQVNSNRVFLARLLTNGEIDPSFLIPRAQMEQEFRATRVVTQEDGRILFAGTFTNINGVAIRHLARLHPDGQLDASFHIGQGFSGFFTPEFNAVLPHPAGGIFVGGSFERFNNEPRQSIVKLKADGSLDSSFRFAGAVGRFIAITQIKPFREDRIVVAGLEQTPEGFHRWFLARLFLDGKIDPTFAFTGEIQNIASVLIQPNDKIIVASSFNSKPLRRLLPDGSLDDSFFPGAPPFASVTQVRPFPGGQIMVGGDFRYPRPILQRMHAGDYLGRGSFEIAAFSQKESEGETLVEVRRVWSFDGEVSVYYYTSNLTATAGQDYVPQSGTLTFRPGERGKALAIRVIDDGQIEEAELFQVHLVPLTPGTTLGPNYPAQIGILDDDAAVEFTSPLVAAIESQRLMRLQVRRVGNSEFPFSVEFTIGRSTALFGIDCHVQPGTLEFQAGENEKQIDLEIFDDAIGEPLEFVEIVLTNAFGVSLGAQSVLRVEIVDDGAFLSVPAKVLRVFENDQEAEARLLQTFSRVPVTVSFGTEDGSGRAGRDYTPVVGNLDFKPGDNLKTVTIPILDNASVDGPRFFDLEMNVTTGEGLITGTNVVRVQILDDESPFSGGRVDPSFTAPLGSNDWVAVILPVENQIYLGGAFSSTGKISGLIRLRLDGSRDSSFSAAVAPSVTALISLRDGGLLAGLSMPMDGSYPGPAVVKLSREGVVDSSFQYEGPSLNIRKLLQLADGKLLIMGDYPDSGSDQGALYRVWPNGQIDDSFIPFSRSIFQESYYYDLLNDFAVLPDGRIVIGGNFDGLQSADYRRLARLQPNGRVDRSFPMQTALSDIQKLIANPDGALLFGGVIQTNSVWQTGIGKIWTDGSFQTNDFLILDGSISAMIASASGGIYVGGSFQVAGDIYSPGIARIDANGRVDTNFWCALPNLVVHALALDPARGVYLAGYIGPTGEPPILTVKRLSTPGGPLAFTAVQRDNDKLRLTLEVPAGLKLNLETSSDLRLWSSLLETNVAGSRFEYTADLPVAGRRFYRATAK